MQLRFTQTVVLLVGLGLATTGCGKYSLGSIRSLKAFKDGNEAYGKGDYRNAVGRYQEAVTQNPDLGFAYFFLGNSYDQMYKPARKGEAENDSYLPKAVENYKKAIEKLGNAQTPQEQQYRRLSYEYLIAAYGSDKLNDFAQAEPVAKQLIELEPGEPSNYQALAKLYEDQARVEDAEAMFKKAIEVKANDPVGYQLLAGFYNRQGQFDKTMEAFAQRANMEPNNPEAWHTIGTYIYDKVNRDTRLAPAQKAAYIKTGLDAEDKAIALNASYYEALTYKNLLIRQQAIIEKNPAVQKQLLAQADELRERALAAQQKQTAETKEKEAAKKASGK